MEKRIVAKIETFRRELGQLIEIDKGVNTRRMIKIRDRLYRKYKIQSNDEHKNVEEILKQKIKALAGRLRRYKDINARKEQNILFSENEHKFYRNLECNSHKEVKIPNKDNVEAFWSSILSKPTKYNRKAKWI